MSSRKKVCILGSGNWGSAIARLIGANTALYPDLFVKEVSMWVFEEDVDGQKLTDIINTRHENVKYLPGKKLPDNVIAVPDVVEAAKDADILVFVVPHQFIDSSFSVLKGQLKASVEGLSLVKGFAIQPGGGVSLITTEIQNVLGPIPMSVLMGANLANEVAEEHFCESTIGCSDPLRGAVYKKLVETDNFRVSVVSDAHTVEMCGALKNIVAIGAGLADGLKLGDNTKAAIIRIGLMEMIKYIREFGDEPKLGTLLESCGVADLVTTCYGGRNRLLGEKLVLEGKSIEELQTEHLNGQKFQGSETAAEVNVLLRQRNLESFFPMFTAVDKICKGLLEPTQFIECLKSHPVYSNPGQYV